MSQHVGSREKKRTLELDRRDDFYSHDRLEDHRLRFQERLAERTDGREAEREFGRVDCVECPIAKYHSYARNRVSRQRALLERLVEALLDRRDVIARHVPTHDHALERGVLPGLGVHLRWLDVPNDTRILTRTARLLLMRVHKLRTLRHRFAERDLRPAGGTGDPILASHPFNIDLKV